MSILRKLVPLALFVSAPVWAQTGKPSAQGDDSKPQTTQSSPSPDSDKKPSPDQTSVNTPADSTKLEPVTIVKAKYSGEAREKALQGEVVVKIVVSETGDVESPEVVSGDPILAESAVDAVKKWKFKPFIRNGKAVKASTKLPFDFAFSEDVQDVKVTPADQNAPAVPPPAAVPAASDAPKVAPPQRVRVSQGVTAGLLVHKVQPVYPPEARHARIQGTVILRAHITKEGRIADLKLVSGPKELAPAAIGAVEQWRYRPYLLLGNPVEVDTEVLVN